MLIYANYAVINDTQIGINELKIYINQYKPLIRTNVKLGWLMSNAFSYVNTRFSSIRVNLCNANFINNKTINNININNTNTINTINTNNMTIVNACVKAV
jgi:hypothetical protein